MNLFANTNQNFINEFTKEFSNNPFVKQAVLAQANLAEQIQKAYKDSEEASKKTMSAFGEQFKMFNQKESMEKFSELVKSSEENVQKIQKFVQDNSKNVFNPEFAKEQFKQLEKSLETTSKSFMEQFEKNSQFFIEHILTKNVEHSINITKEMTDSLVKHAEEQANFFINFQKDLISGLKNKESMKDVQGTISKYSQTVMDSNAKTVTEGVKNMVAANTKAVADNVKSVKKIIANA